MNGSARNSPSLFPKRGEWCGNKNAPISSGQRHSNVKNIRNAFLLLSGLYRRCWSYTSSIPLSQESRTVPPIGNISPAEASAEEGHPAPKETMC